MRGVGQARPEVPVASALRLTSRCIDSLSGWATAFVDPSNSLSRSLLEGILAQDLARKAR